MGKKPSMLLMRRGVYALLDDLSKAHDTEFDWAIHVPDVEAFLRKSIAEKSALGDEVLSDVARKLTRAYVEAKAPPVPTESGQLVLWYDPDALLALGEREVVRMAEAEYPHLERWRTVLTANFQSQASAYFGHTTYIDDRLPRLRASNGRLKDVEAALAGEDDAEDRE